MAAVRESGVDERLDHKVEPHVNTQHVVFLSTGETGLGFPPGASFFSDFNSQNYWWLFWWLFALELHADSCSDLQLRKHY